MVMAMPSDERNTLSKAARLAALIELDDRGLLHGKTLQAIADAVGGGTNRSTILRDLRLLPKVRVLRQQMRKRLE